MSTSDSDPIEYRQNRFDEVQEEVKVACKRAGKRADARRYGAYALKSLAVLGGIAIASGVIGPWAQTIGILITVAVAVDSIFSNHKRLLAQTEATYAYQALSDAAVRRHRQELGPILDAKQAGDGAAKAKLAKLLDELIAMLQDGQTRVEKALRQADLEGLRAVTLENTPSSTTGAAQPTT